MTPQAIIDQFTDTLAARLICADALEDEGYDIEANALRHNLWFKDRSDSLQQGYWGEWGIANGKGNGKGGGNGNGNEIQLRHNFIVL